MILRIHYELQK